MAAKKKGKASYTEEQKQAVKDFIANWIKENGKERGSMAAAVEHFKSEWKTNSTSLAQTFTSWMKGSEAKTSKGGSSSGSFDKIIDNIAALKKRAKKLEALKEEIDSVISAINAL